MLKNWNKQKAAQEQANKQGLEDLVNAQLKRRADAEAQWNSYIQSLKITQSPVTTVHATHSYANASTNGRMQQTTAAAPGGFTTAAAPGGFNTAAAPGGFSQAAPGLSASSAPIMMPHTAPPSGLGSNVSSPALHTPIHAPPAQPAATAQSANKGEGSAPPPGHAKGDRVMVQGLKAAAHHNGKKGTLSDWQESDQRWVVLLDNEEKPFKIKPDNLIVQR